VGNQIEGGTMTESVAIDLPLEPGSARRARQQLQPFKGLLDEESFVDLCLLVDELVIEALRAADEGAVGPIELRAERDGDRVRVTMADGGRAYQLPSRRPEPGDPGFGLHLVQRLSDRWGMRRDRNHATVWLEMLGTPRRAV
jgi:anti-sigma regulatory factor (Ser/Thr protein kinase)